MKYMGSKARHAKDIISVVLSHAEGLTDWVEPFVGGANIIDKVPPVFNRYGNDVNAYLIEMFKAVQQGWLPPLTVTEDEYLEIKARPSDYSKALVGFVGIGCSYSGKFWGGGVTQEATRTKGCLVIIA